VIYSALHFVKPTRVEHSCGQVTWSSGLACLSGSVTRSSANGMSSWVRDIISGRLYFGLAYARRRHYTFPSGLHAGWVTGQRIRALAGSLPDYRGQGPWPVLASAAGVGCMAMPGTSSNPLRAPEPSSSGGGAPATIVWPRNCPFCGCPLSDIEPGIICPDCLASAKLIEPPFCRQCASPFTGTVTGETLVCGYCQDLRFYFSRAIAGRAGRRHRARLHLGDSSTNAKCTLARIWWIGYRSPPGVGSTGGRSTRLSPCRSTRANSVSGGIQPGEYLAKRHWQSN